MESIYRAPGRLEVYLVSLELLHSRQPLDVERFAREAEILAPR